MIFTEPMKQLVAAVLRSDADKVTRALLDQGLLHFSRVAGPGSAGAGVEVSQGSPAARGQPPAMSLEPVSPAQPEAEIAETRKRIESFLALADPSGGSAAVLRRDLSKSLQINQLSALDLKEANRELDKISAELQSLRDRQKNLQQEILKIEEIGRQLSLFGDLQSSIRAQSRTSLLTIHVGTIPTIHEESLRAALKPLPSVLQTLRHQDERLAMLLIGMKRDESQINAILDRFSWVDSELDRSLDGVSEGIVKDMDGKLVTLRHQQEEMDDAAGKLMEAKKEQLQSMWSNLRLNELYSRVQSYFRHTARTVVFTGWLPASKQRSFEEVLMRVSEGRCYLEWNDPDQDDYSRVPVDLEGPKFLSPFRMLVSNFSIPEYRTINPTPFVALAYLTMFGLMFGDAGHGLVLVLLGILGRYLLRRRSEKIQDLARLITWCGFSAVVAGVLFGSYFGRQWFAPIWFDYHGVIFGESPGGLVRDIYGILEITVYFGIAVIGMGLLINWINLTAQKKWVSLLLDKTGILGGWIYGAGVYLAMDFARSGYRELPAGGTILLLLGIPVVVLLLKPPLAFLRERKEDPSRRLEPLTIFDFILEWVVEILEIVSGYLANTLSFMRVAGLGIAHVSLLMAFDRIAETVSPGGGIGFAAIIILAVGNLFVIGLEGLSAGIQSLRLNYYEFFSKYFTGRGIAYIPVNLKMRDANA